MLAGWRRTEVRGTTVAVKRVIQHKRVHPRCESGCQFEISGPDRNLLRFPDLGRRRLRLHGDQERPTRETMELKTPHQ